VDTMELNFRQKQNVRNAFESILRADYISVTDIDQLAKLEKYYIDFYNNVSSLLQKQDNYISGRRGTGKTTLLLRGYYECLKTISPKIKQKSNYFGEDKILPIYIDLSNCSEIFSNNYEINLIELHFVRQIIEALKKQLEIMFDENFLLLFKKENPALEDLEYIENALVKGITLVNERKISVESKENVKENIALKSKVSFKEAEANFEYSENEENERVTKFNEIRGIDIQSFLNKINEIRQKAKINCIYVFLDEFSDLNTEEQEKLSSLIKKFLGSKINMYFKIGVITDRFCFGDKIRIGRDLFTISLDLNEFVERYGGIVLAIKKMQEFMELMVEKRLELFCPELKHADIFKVKKDELYYRLAREAMGVPRSVGLILQNAWIQSESANQDAGKIGLQELNYGIRTTRKIYYKQFQGSIKARLIPGFYMDLWSDILEKAISEKTKNPARPASHILIDPVRKEYMNILCENFLIHFLEEGRSSKYGGSYNLYSIDYDICFENNIKFAEDKDEFTAVRFIYDSVLSKYDGYFLKERVKSYRCETCGKIYEEEDVCKFKVKRCFDDDSLLEEIIHKETPKTDGNMQRLKLKS
jgi:hypothetical protein